MPVVVDISSDEEEDLKEESKNTDFEWIEELLFNSGDESDGDSDVVFLHENKAPELKSKPSTLHVKVVDDGDDDDDDDDDDCLVLEGDPENGVTSVDDEDSSGSDELVVVGEKGQVACRDYPHARHLCAKFPFSSTPHDKHCGLCHCYVCDTLAPCLKWGTGILSSDHCHANDKTELWKVQRKDFKRTLSCPLPASTKYGTSSLGVVHPQSNENLPCDITHLSPISVLRNQAVRSSGMPTPSLNCIAQNQVSRPKATYAQFSLNSVSQNQISRPTYTPVSKAINQTIPNVANCGRFLGSRSNLPGGRNRSHYVPKQLLGVRNHVIQREQGRGVSSLGPQFLRSPILSKGGVRSLGGILAANHSSHGSSGFNNHVNGVLQPVNFHVTTGFSNPVNSSIFSHSSSGPVSLNRVNPHNGTPEPLYGQSLSQSNDSQNFHQTCIQGNDATQSGVMSQDTCQPKPQEQNLAITAKRGSAVDSSWAENISQSTEPLVECSPLQTLESTNQPPNVEKFSTHSIETVEPVNESSHTPNVIFDFENWLLGQETGPVATDNVLPFELNIPSPDPSPFNDDTDMLLSPWW
ncbi:uncharacterized protein LOC131644493 [Vicia villosa]|uniref:uncharacterized protein LOC131644493 n=1 Tax=Vicia villosa TaxID=3911 RepID=UPI00273AFEA9|nr:uncharacterized protein LOC131644493 [Vicia villosa]XP_058770988.1 uncharacterized protein LOC131644493 [Vicia villosa]